MSRTLYKSNNSRNVGNKGNKINRNSGQMTVKKNNQEKNNDNNASTKKKSKNSKNDNSKRDNSKNKKVVKYGMLHRYLQSKKDFKRYFDITMRKKLDKHLDGTDLNQFIAERNDLYHKQNKAVQVFGHKVYIGYNLGDGTNNMTNKTNHVETGENIAKRHYDDLMEDFGKYLKQKERNNKFDYNKHKYAKEKQEYFKQERNKKRNSQDNTALNDFKEQKRVENENVRMKIEARKEKEKELKKRLKKQAEIEKNIQESFEVRYQTQQKREAQAQQQQEQFSNNYYQRQQEVNDALDKLSKEEQLCETEDDKLHQELAFFAFHEREQIESPSKSRSASPRKSPYVNGPSRYQLGRKRGDVESHGGRNGRNSGIRKVNNHKNSNLNLDWNLNEHENKNENENIYQWIDFNDSTGLSSSMRSISSRKNKKNARTDFIDFQTIMTGSTDKSRSGMSSSRSRQFSTDNRNDHDHEDKWQRSYVSSSNASPRLSNVYNRVKSNKSKKKKNKAYNNNYNNNNNNNHNNHNNANNWFKFDQQEEQQQEQEQRRKGQEKTKEKRREGRMSSSKRRDDEVSCRVCFKPGEKLCDACYEAWVPRQQDKTNDIRAHSSRSNGNYDYSNNYHFGNNGSSNNNNNSSINQISDDHDQKDAQNDNEFVFSGIRAGLHKRRTNYYDWDAIGAGLGDVSDNEDDDDDDEDDADVQDDGYDGYDGYCEDEEEDDYDDNDNDDDYLRSPQMRSGRSNGYSIRESTGINSVKRGFV